MRGRQSAAMLSIVGAGDLVATSEDDYVAIATRLANDAPRRAALRRTIGEGLSSLFDDQAPVRAFASVLEAAAGVDHERDHARNASIIQTTINGAR
jgi:predicted O-linked N-acetylglucosamine transferase (SPINDLY family)